MQDFIIKNIIYIVLATAALTAPVQSFAEEKPHHKQAPTVKKGMIDLSTWNFEKDGIVELKGEWEFYWNELLDADGIKKTFDKPNMFSIPAKWAGEISGKKLSKFGYATYKATVKLPKINVPFGIKVNEAASAIKLFVDGKEVTSIGTVGVDEASSRGSGGINYYYFTPKKQNYELILHIANFVNREGGTWRPIEIGLAQTLRAEKSVVMLGDAFLIGSIFIMTLYHLGLYLFRRKNPSTLYFATFCFALGIRATSAGEAEFLLTTFPNLSYGMYKGIEYFGFYLSVPACVNFIYSLYPHEVSKIFNKVVWWIGLVFVSAAILMPVSVFTDMVEMYQLFTLITIVLLLFQLRKAVYKKRESIYTLLIGFLVFLSCAVTDIVRQATKAFEAPELTHYGVFLFIFAQSIVLARRFSNAFNQIELDEQQIREMHDELIEKEKARTLFFHNTSHELRTPLNGIIGYLQLFKSGRYGDISDIAKNQLSKINNLANSLKNQVNTILDLAKSKKGELKLVSSLIQLSELKHNIEVLAGGLLLKFPNTEFSLDAAWDEDSNEDFKGDKEKIFTIVRNLLGNSFKFKNSDKLNLITLSIQVVNSNLEITVADTGIGIPEDKHTIIFEEFEQVAKDASRSFEGTGLGLAMVKRNVDLMGGTISLKSEVDAGTTFTISIPEQQNIDNIIEEASPSDQTEDITQIEPDLAGEAESKTSKEEISFTPTETTKSYNILLIDDNEVNLEVIGDTLRVYGYPVETASGGREGLQIIRANKPDLILLDLMMPEVSGEDVLKEIKSDDSLKDIPVILLTARASQEDKILGLGYGADDYLAKPIMNDELLLRVKNTLVRTDLVRTTESLNNREKMAKIGELMGELSHELKNLNFTANTSIEPVQTRIAALLTSFDFVQPEFDHLIESMFAERVDFEIEDQRHEQFQNMSYPKELKIELKSIARILKKYDIDTNELMKLWDCIVNSGPESIRKFEKHMYIYSLLLQLDNSSKNAQILIHSVLDYSRSRTTFGKCNIIKIISTCSTILKKKIKINEIELINNLDEKDSAMANTSDMNQIILNLLSNAVEAFPDTFKNKQINISSKMENGMIEYAFRDNGMGIPEKNLNKVFENKFSTKGESGNGLGLYVSKNLAAKNGGSLEVTSEQGNTTFTLKLKAAS